MFFTQGTHERDVPTPRAQRQLMVRASLRLSSTSATLMTDEEIVCPLQVNSSLLILDRLCGLFLTSQSKLNGRANIP
jgi:hypothetical protein